MKSISKKLLSILLILTIAANLLPMNVFASEPDELRPQASETESGAEPEQAEAAEPEEELPGQAKAAVREELPGKRERFSKQFQMSDGTTLAAVYPVAVHYEENGEWKEVDNSLTKGDGAYTTASQPLKVSFPVMLSEENGITVETDGCAASFAPMGELHIMPESEDLGIIHARAAEAETESEEEREERRKEMSPERLAYDKVFASLSYAEIYPGASLRYDLVSDSLKESLILASFDETLRGFRYYCEFDGLTPKLEEDGSITLSDAQEKPVLIMPAPFLLDGQNAMSTDVDIILKEEGDGYMLTYLLPTEWLAEEERAWPVVLDPCINTQLSDLNCQCRTVWEYEDLYYADFGHYILGLFCGYGICWNMGAARTYLQFNALPELTSADVIVQSNIYMFRSDSYGNPIPVETYLVQEPWTPETIGWASQPSVRETTVDMSTVNQMAVLLGVWQITDAVRSWYEDGNNGLMFRAPGYVETGNAVQWVQMGNGYYYDELPFISIIYRNVSGLESYWDYSSASAGRAGTGHVNACSGNLVWVRGDLGFDGSRMPVSVSHVYNADESMNNDFGLGYGWRTNYNQRLHLIEGDPNDPYSQDQVTWEDGDGTVHWFNSAGTNKWKDEDGLELTLEKHIENNVITYTITDKYDNSSLFDSLGRLTRISNNQATKSSITVSYTDAAGFLISAVTDGAGRVYSFTYTNGLLSKTAFMGTGNTEISCVTYGYDGNGNLTSITDKDAKTSYYTYNIGSGNPHLLTSAADVDGYMLSYTYNTFEINMPNRVTEIAESFALPQGGTDFAGKLCIEYGHNQTALTDYHYTQNGQTYVKGNAELLQFNDWGNTVCVQDDEGHARFGRYATDTGGTKGNQLTAASRLQSTVANLLPDGNFENQNGSWAAGPGMTAVLSQTRAYFGASSLKFQSLNEYGYAISGAGPYTVQPGESLTLSGWLYVEHGSVAFLRLFDNPENCIDSEAVTGGGWTRVEASFVNSGNTPQTYSASIIFYGTAYLDGVQMEYRPTASRFNLVENGDFRYNLYNWSGSYGLTPGDHTVSVSETAAPGLSGTAFRIEGDFYTSKRLWQDVPESGEYGDTYVFGAWAKGDSLPLRCAESGIPGDRKFGVRVSFFNGSNFVNSVYASFNPDCGSGDDWQYVCKPAVALGTYSYICVELLYEYNGNSVLFDGVQLYRGQFGESYTYDGSGNLTSVKNLQAQITSYQYQNNDLTRAMMPTGAYYVYTYDEWHNVKTASSYEGVVYSFTYDAYGNNTSVSVGSIPNNKITVSSAYDAGGNTLLSMTDALGNTTAYGYDSQTNILGSVRYPEDSLYTETSYDYDDVYRMTSAEKPVGPWTTLTTEYTYNADDNLTGLETATTAYTLSYGSFSLLNSVSIGNSNLASYTYTNDGTNRLRRLSFGNGKYVDYEYDDRGRVLGKTWEDGTGLRYYYDNDGALVRTIDSSSGRTMTYTYDPTDRLVRHTEVGGGYECVIGYEYDALNNISMEREELGNSAWETYYSYDRDNRISEIRHDNVTAEYYYDYYLGRNSAKNVFLNDMPHSVTSMTYDAGTGGSSNRVHTLTNSADNYEVTYTYTYDGNGNMTSVSDGSNTTSYEYDKADRLIRENNQAAGKTWTWSYDAGGNITDKIEYSYTTGALGTVLDVVLYGYDGSWGDLLTSCGGFTVTSDAIGNILSDGRRAYTWEHGRQLETCTQNQTTWYYFYNADGRRTGRWGGNTGYSYAYDGGRLTDLLVSNDFMHFIYDATGPLGVIWNGITYFYLRNLQGDITAILNGSGAAVVTYSYDAWGKILSIGGSLASTLGIQNPFRYRGYVYDQETGLYYLQTRYYDPELGRFISADSFASTGQGPLGCNMFAYCLNNPATCTDEFGQYCRNAAVEYAEKWSGKYNSEYYRYKTDCANFVSQCLSAGEVKMTDEWYCKKAKKTSYSLSERVKSWFHSNYRYDWDIGEAWRLANKQYLYFSNPDNGYINGEVITVSSVDDISKIADNGGVQSGDLLFFSNDGISAYHAAIITTVDDNMIYYAGHTRSAFDKPLSSGIGSKTAFIIRIYDDA